MNKKVLVAARSFVHSPEAKAILEAKGYELLLNTQDRPLTEVELLEKISGVSALITGNDAVTEGVIAAGVPTLKIIAKQGVGYNNINIAAARQRGIPVTITPGANSQSVADLAVGLMIAISRRIPQLDRSVRSGSWKRLVGRELNGKVLGIIGMGHIGEEVAKRAYGFGLKIIAYDVCHRQEMVRRYEVTYLSLSKVLEQADYLSLHAPALPETVGMINKDSLSAMKATAYLINTARGDLIVENDLYQALTQGVIAGAALDTFAQEPLENSCFFGLENVILTPHIGANTQEAVIRTGKMAAEEVVQVLSGLSPRYAVNQ